jgi:hypothetical protein
VVVDSSIGLPGVLKRTDVFDGVAAIGNAGQ